MPALRFSLPRPLLTGLVTALLALHTWLAVSATIDLGVTGDETVHLTGGYSYWRFNDYRLHPENGNLPQRWAALPLLVSNPTLNATARPDLWRESDVWQIGQSFFFESGNSIDYLLLNARSMMVLWSVATGLLVFFWSRKLWGDLAGLFSLLLYSVSPTTLAHGALVTSDMCAAFWLLAATGAWWRVTEQITAPRLALSLAAAAFAAVAKFSCLLLLPTAALIVFWRLARPHALQVNTSFRAPGRAITTVGGRLGIYLGVAGLHVMAAAALIWLFFGLRYSGFSPELPAALTYYPSTDGVLPPEGLLRWAIMQNRELNLLPEAFIHGFTFVVHAAQTRGAFLVGEYSNTGWWWFFPFAFLVKSSLAELIAFSLFPLFWVIRFFKDRTAASQQAGALVPLLLLFVVYAAVSLASHLNIGHRHILPLYPILFIFAGYLVGGTSPRPQAIATGPSRAANEPAAVVSATFIRLIATKPFPVTGLVAVLVAGVAIIESTGIRPHYLAFFNAAAGGPRQGWRLLVDSSLDWGQNLPRLRLWLDAHRNPAEKVYLSAFGADDPFYRGMKVTELSPYYSFERKLRWEPLRGGLYCVSASLLQDVYSPYSGPWTRDREAGYQHLLRTVEYDLKEKGRSPFFGINVSTDMELWSLDRLRFARLGQLLRVRKPDAIVGHTLFIYRLSDKDVHDAVRGTLTELADAVERGAAHQPQGN